MGCILRYLIFFVKEKQLLYMLQRCLDFIDTVISSQDLLTSPLHFFQATSALMATSFNKLSHFPVHKYTSRFILHMKSLLKDLALPAFAIAFTNCIFSNRFSDILGQGSHLMCSLATITA